jgi:hypothetical protein
LANFENVKSLGEIRPMTNLKRMIESLSERNCGF